MRLAFVGKEGENLQGVEKIGKQYRLVVNKLPSSDCEQLGISLLELGIISPLGENSEKKVFLFHPDKFQMIAENMKAHDDNRRREIENVLNGGAMQSTERLPRIMGEYKRVEKKLFLLQDNILSLKTFLTTAVGLQSDDNELRRYKSKEEIEDELITILEDDYILWVLARAMEENGKKDIKAYEHLDNLSTTLQEKPRVAGQIISFFEKELDKVVGQYKEYEKELKQLERQRKEKRMILKTRREQRENVDQQKTALEEENEYLQNFWDLEPLKAAA